MDKSVEFIVLDEILEWWRVIAWMLTLNNSTWECRPPPRLPRSGSGDLIRSMHPDQDFGSETCLFRDMNQIVENRPISQYWRILRKFPPRSESRCG